jgi:hypothetical protein
MMLLLTRVPIELLFGIHLTSLQSSGAGINVCLPGWRTKILEAARRSVIENLLDLLEGLLGGLGEDEQHVEEHCYAEDTEHDVDLPSDVGKCGRDEVGKSEVESPEWKVSDSLMKYDFRVLGLPVGGSRESNCLSSHT